MINVTTIATGKAREEGRQPSHDGEYITIYYNDSETESGTLIAEHNAGTFCLDDQYTEEGGSEDWDSIKAEAYQSARRGLGEPMRFCGSDAREEMIELGWATRDQFDGNAFIASAVRPA